MVFRLILSRCLMMASPVGSHVVCAAFELTRPITVLDMTRFTEGAKNRSIFSPVARSRNDQWQFMQLFRLEITKPILPDDEVFDYVPTQAVAEFIHFNLAGKLGNEIQHIDGIIYGSAQRPGGRNIALFGEAALVEGNNEEPIDEFTNSKSEQARMWGEGAGFEQPTFEGMMGPFPALRCVREKTSVQEIIGAEISFEEGWNPAETNPDF